MGDRTLATQHQSARNSVASQEASEADSKQDRTASKRASLAALRREQARHESGQEAQSNESCERSEIADEREQKKVLIEQLYKFVNAGFRGIDRAVISAMRGIDCPELPKTDTTKLLLGIAASTVLGGGAGALAGWLAAEITTAAVTARVAGTTTSVVGGAITRAFQANSAQAVRSLDNVKDAFLDGLLIQLQDSETRFAAGWTDVYAGLSLFSVDELKWINRLHAEGDQAELFAKIRHETFVAWANFLARAKHGAMGPWDHWQENGSRGAIALPGAEKKPTLDGPDPTRNNIAPDNDSPLLANVQRPMQEDAFGVLEIFVDTSGRIEDLPGYRMRLDNVGPKVREEFRTSGSVRDLRVNKVVHICSHYHHNVRVDPPASIASLMITSDGHVRAINWSELQKMHFEPKDGPVWDPMGFGECSDNIIHGKETADCNIDRKAMVTEVTAFAKLAQELPLTWLEA
jgi:hypothetical protein